jgi:hypothetical protein
VTSYKTRTGAHYFYFDTSGVVSGIGEKDFTIHTGAMPVPDSYGAEIQRGPFLTLTYSKGLKRRPTLGQKLRITAIDYRRDGIHRIYAEDWSEPEALTTSVPEKLPYYGVPIDDRPLCGICGTVPLADNGDCPCCTLHQCTCREGN